MESDTPIDKLPGIAVSAFDNSGRAPLLVPGAGMPLYVEAVPASGTARFTHAYDNDGWPMRATTREIAMLRCMEQMTEKPNWERDVFSDEMVAEWKHEVWMADWKIRAHWKISDKAWAWCVDELRDKARRFIETGRTVVLDYGWGAVCKKDLGAELPGLLKKTVDEVVERDPKKGQPRPDGVARIVDAHLAPLVYGQTRVLVDGGAVGREDMDEWYGRGVPLARPKDDKYVKPTPRDIPYNLQEDALRRRWYALGTLSPGFQWLPCEVAFNPGVQITSYINDLHPHEQADAYPAMEAAISVAIESWNDILSRIDTDWGGCICTGHTPARIRTFGVQYPFGLPAWEEEYSETERDENLEARAKIIAKLPALEDEVARGEVGSRAEILRGNTDRSWIPVYVESRHLVHPEPGVSFSYQEWKERRNVTRAIVPPPQPTEPVVPEAEVHPAHPVSLQDEFRHAGLQVVVQVNSIELTPAKPRHEDKMVEYDYEGNEWWRAADGLVTDYIAATSILFFEFDNVRPVGVRFRQPVDLEPYNFAEAEHCDHNGIMEVFDLTPLHYDYSLDLCQPGAFPAVQELGEVVATEGRMMSFPGPVLYHFEPCQLIDASRPGRARYLVLHLVDPNYRVCSTRNVPPQRLDWWAYDLARKAPDALHRLPTELFDMIVAESAGTGGILDADGMERAREAMEEERRQNADEIDFGHHQFCDDMDHIFHEDS
ncbi:hypothetical protein QBC39DRAFT_351414 [Podospora conica]|nr:hypothetical protein QBC39DRAFT_351414 [Schizothecium conicum]